MRPWLLCAMLCSACRAPDAARSEPEAPARPTSVISRADASAPERAAPSFEPPTSPSGASTAWPRAPQPVASAWCGAGMPSLDQHTCYVLPERRSTALVVYLHGIVPPEEKSALKSNLQKVVSSASQRAGVALILPRGIQGLAPRGHDGWWGWPTGEPAYSRHVGALTRRFEEARRTLEDAVGARFSHVYLAGSSSGAYFVTLLALRGDFAADGYAALSGGSRVALNHSRKVEPRPFYVGYGKQDSVGPGARALAELLRDRGWPVRIAAHPVGHGAREVYLDEAFAFWAGERSASP